MHRSPGPTLQSGAVWPSARVPDREEQRPAARQELGSGVSDLTLRPVGRRQRLCLATPSRDPPQPSPRTAHGSCTPRPVNSWYVAWINSRRRRSSVWAHPRNRSSPPTVSGWDSSTEWFSRKVATTGGPPVTVFEDNNRMGGPLGATWGADGTIVYAESSGAGCRTRLSHSASRFHLGKVWPTILRSPFGRASDGKPTSAHDSRGACAAILSELTFMRRMSTVAA